MECHCVWRKIHVCVGLIPMTKQREEWGPRPRDGACMPYGSLF